MTNTLLTGICPVCDAYVALAAGIVESEVVSCNDCKNRLVVERIAEKTVSLIKAPVVEEDWGE